MKEFEEQIQTRKVEIQSNKVLQDYINEFNNDIKLNQFNLREKSLTCSSIWAKWISYLFLEKDNLQRIVDAKQKIIKNKTSHPTMVKSPSILKLKSEDKLTENDETIQKLNILFKNTSDCIDYIERTLNVLSNFGFNIKNAIEALKLQLNH